MLKDKAILIVDRSAILMIHLKMILKETPGIKTIKSANSITQAKKIINTKQVSVVILDLELRDGNGLDLLKWIKEKNNKLPVIILSNYSDECHRFVAKQEGADYFFDKSIEFEEVFPIATKLISMQTNFVKSNS